MSNRPVKSPSRSYLRPQSSQPFGGNHHYGNVIGGDSIRPLTPQPVREMGSGVGSHRLSKARRVLIIACTLLGFFFSSLDAAIVATSMVSISDELQEFMNAPWIILAYLLSYMGFAVFLSRLSDICGRRDVLLGSWMIFLCFSFACARASTMLQLIIFRAFQGIGGSGLYSLAQITLTEYGPVTKPQLVGAMIGFTLAISLVLGPIIGGLISHKSDWRWIFDLNAPFSAAAMIMIAMAWPSREDRGAHASVRYSWNSVKRIDFLGCATLLCACCLLIVGVQQAASARYHWSDSVIIAILALSALSGIVFIIWQVSLNSGSCRDIKPIFPVNLLRNRVFTSTIVVTLLTGFTYLGLMVIVPERFQIIHGDNPLFAGLKLLPLLGSCTLGSFVAAAASKKTNNTSPTLVVSAGLQLLGTGLTTIISKPDSSTAALYGFQVIIGFGIGLCFSAATISVSIQVLREDLATGHGVISQARLLGGCLGISICTVILNFHNNKYLLGKLDEGQMHDLLTNPTRLSGWDSDYDKALTREVYAMAFVEEVKVMMYICAAMLAVSFFGLERHPLPMSTLTDHQMPDPALVGQGDKESPVRASHSSTWTELSDLQPLARPRQLSRLRASTDGLPI
ncbi:related to multidrug transporter [Cephalotrichum gorgonifer]|uniref:Related to multidrug transporter n=1 Tax=Cephalotrichum gorgonifer TaxID=2041049 RepID=A0AAE8SWL5_9PEZI|nr:related to multidrug transporter [Cephalotrichum gorgonifer]